MVPERIRSLTHPKTVAFRLMGKTCDSCAKSKLPLRPKGEANSWWVCCEDKLEDMEVGEPGRSACPMYSPRPSVKESGA
jgi:hypothetical protein